MTYLIVFGIYIAIFTGLFFLSGRRFGLPTLGLAVGALLATLWAEPLAPQVAEAGIIIERPPLTSVVAIGLTLLPALFLIGRAPKVEGKMNRLLGALLFACALALLTYDAFSSAVVLDDASKAAAGFIERYRDIIVTVLLVIAIGETGLRPHHKSKK